MENTLKRYKIIIVGQGSVGKSSFIHRYAKDEFIKNYKQTLGVDFTIKNIVLKDGMQIRLHLWDIQGQEDAQRMTSVFYRQAKAAIVMYDLTNKHSFDVVRMWKQDIDSKIYLDNFKLLPSILIANKLDLKSERQIHELDGNNLASQLKFTCYSEISVKTGENVNQSMDKLVKEILLNDNDREYAEYIDEESFGITSIPQRKNDSTKCCFINDSFN